MNSQHAIADEKRSVVVVMPAYNAAKTLEKTYKDIPPGSFDEIILVDDGSGDATVDIAKKLNITVFRHDRNYGYGANQKTCYAEALRMGQDIIVMLHPDYQYDPSLLPTLVAPISEGHADVVLGSRLLGNNPMKQGMPWWKYVSNRVLTVAENLVFRLRLSEYHTGYRSYSRKVLESVNFAMNSDGFVFDQEIIAQIVARGFRIREVPVPTRYMPEASSAGFIASVGYGLRILVLLVRYLLYKHRLVHDTQFESLQQRYQRVVYKQLTRVKPMTTHEPQYQPHITLRDTKGLARLGVMANATWDADPKRLVFMLSRYKFVAKMLSGKQRVLEVGCGDAFGTRIVLQEVGRVTAIDFDPVFVQDALERMDARWTFECKVHDMLTGPIKGPFDAAYSLDVLEHIAEQNEATFISNIAKSLVPQGVLIIGTPSLQSQSYASPGSGERPSNRVTAEVGLELKAMLLRFFHNVFIFSMNDEVVHTGFYPMANYLFALCVGSLEE